MGCFTRIFATGIAAVGLPIASHAGAEAAALWGSEVMQVTVIPSTLVGERDRHLDVRPAFEYARGLEAFVLAQSADAYTIEAGSRLRELTRSREATGLRLRYNPEASLALFACARRLKVGWQTRF